MDLKSIFIDRMENTDKYNSLLDYVDSSASSGQKDVLVSDGSQFSEGEEVIIYDKQDTFESCVIDSISSNTLTMTINLTNTYVAGASIGKYFGYLDTDNSKYYRLPVPDLGDGSDGAFVSSGNETWDEEKNFTSISIINGDIITIDENVEIKCQGDVTIINGEITAKGQGHAGGGIGTFHGIQGTSELGSGSQSTSANGGGGGGGDQYSGQGYGGGGGSYGSAGIIGGGNRTDYPGYPGIIYNDEQLSTFTIAFLKGSGGGGGGYYGGNGGAGGGIIRVSCKNLYVDPTNGYIDCDGNDGLKGTGSNSDYAGGGGGAGGTIYLQVLNVCSISTLNVHAIGGIGGLAGDNSSYYKGGDGGNGRIRIEAGKIIGTSSPTLATGYLTNIGGYTKYGFYNTKKITTTSTNTIVQSSVNQSINSVNLNADASSGQKDVFIDVSEVTSNITPATGESSYELNMYAGTVGWQSFTTLTANDNQVFEVTSASIYGCLYAAGTVELECYIGDMNGTPLSGKETLTVTSTSNSHRVFTFLKPARLLPNTQYKLYVSCLTTTGSRFEWQGTSYDGYDGGTWSYSSSYDASCAIYLTKVNTAIDNFYADKEVIILENGKYEVKTIDTVNETTGKISFTENLDNDYTTDANIFCKYVSSFASLTDSGENENQQEMSLVNIRKISDSLCEFNFQNTLRTPSPKNTIVGQIRIDGNENDDEDIYITEADWFYY